jgi:hypothetical protein
MESQKMNSRTLHKTQINQRNKKLSKIRILKANNFYMKEIKQVPIDLTAKENV